MKEAIKLFLVCPECGNSLWIKRDDEEAEGAFECASCGSLVFTEEMTATSSEEKSEKGGKQLKEVIDALEKARKAQEAAQAVKDRMYDKIDAKADIDTATCEEIEKYLTVLSVGGMIVDGLSDTKTAEEIAEMVMANAEQNKAKESCHATES